MITLLKQIKKTARKFLGEDAYNYVIVPRHYVESALANVRFGFPAFGMRIIGVTGTNGKTTTANMLASIFTAAGHKVGLISTATLGFGGGVRENDTHLTTAGGWVIQGQLAKMRKRGCDIVVLETSSHALAQGRVFGIPYDVAVMTNLTQDHLDYHHTMEAYAAAKAKLFKRASKLSVLNIDDKWFHTFEKAAKARVLTYGQADLADTRLLKVSLKPEGANFAVEVSDEEHDFHTNQTGLFNVYNAMAAITVAKFYGVSDETIQKGLFELKSVPGRMQFIQEGKPFSIVIDHAHTVDALVNLFKELKKLQTKRMIVVIGCDGDRDPGKREPIGKLCAETGDAVILTDLENYTENPENIRAMVKKGIDSAKKKPEFKEIADRRQAISAALKMAKPGDMVVIPGLGNQDYRGMVSGKIAWDDRQVVREELKKLKK
jgi:UDP-N-acetylmuramoyl-L-alanyl-D-glutamate--2,6-diaminopimelate ligase